MEMEDGKQNPYVRMNLIILGMEEENKVNDQDIFVLDIFRFHRFDKNHFLLDTERESPFINDEFWNKDVKYAGYFVYHIKGQMPAAAIINDIKFDKQQTKNTIGTICIIQIEDNATNELPNDLSVNGLPYFSQEEIENYFQKK